MTIKEMVLQFKLEANKVDSNQSQKLPLPTMIKYINDGQLQLMKTRYGANNNYAATLEQIQKRIDEWQRLIVPHAMLDGTADKENWKYDFDLPFTKGYCFLLRCSFIASKGDCKDQAVLITRMTQSDDLNINLDNPNTSSNFEWREINYRLATDKILAYTDPSFSFSIDKANIDYLRYPRSVDISGYRHFDFSDSTNVDCELPVFLHPEIIHEAVFLFKESLNHPDQQAAAAVKAHEE